MLILLRFMHVFICVNLSLVSRWWNTLVGNMCYLMNLLTKGFISQLVLMVLIQKFLDIIVTVGINEFTLIFGFHVQLSCIPPKNALALGTQRE